MNIDINLNHVPFFQGGSSLFDQFLIDSVVQIMIWTFSEESTLLWTQRTLDAALRKPPKKPKGKPEK